ncbi:MAG TPA: PLP-dependent aminotransferase family protein [Candidatus Baltobacteraceae bacterium]|nr:PLP-dependent aminotransferase family protein [Candidatus Baltobacteraceae bacterium]
MTSSPLDGIVLDSRDRRPLYVQIADGIVGLIEGGELHPGDRLPAMRALATQLECGLITVSQAYDSLVARGRACARVGKGTFITKPVDPIASIERRWEPEIGTLMRARMEGLSERLARADVPGTVSMAYAHPAPETFPMAEFGRCLQSVLTEDPPEVMQYGTPHRSDAAVAAGDAELRETLARALRTRGVSAAANNIIVCSGAQQAADLVAGTLLESRSLVAAESPSYAPTLAVFDARGVGYVEIAADADGLRVDDVERVFAEYRPRLFYVNPFAQNPTGTILPQRRAKAIVELARRYDVVVLEDQTGWVFTYDAAPPAPLAAHDRDGRVVLIESLSKSIFPALRIGYLFAKGALHSALTEAKARADSFTSTLMQRALRRFLNSPAYSRHLRSARALYQNRRDHLLVRLAQAIPWAEILPPQAGMTLWFSLPPSISTGAAFEACAREKLLVMPADASYPTRSGPAALRLGFGDLDEPTIDEAVIRLARAMRTFRS